MGKYILTLPDEGSYLEYLFPIAEKGPIGPKGDTGPPYGLNGIYHGDYIFWDIHEQRWTVGGQNIKIGSSAGLISQKTNAIAIGEHAGENTQGSNAIAIGRYAGYTAQNDNSIILNSTGKILNSQGNTGGFYVKPIQNKFNQNQLMYDSSSGEITYFSSSLFQGSRVYGSFYYDQVFEAYLPTPVQRFIFNQSSFSHNVFIQNNSKIKFLTNGVFWLKVSTGRFRVLSASGTYFYVDFWLNKNGMNLPDSYRTIDLMKRNEYVIIQDNNSLINEFNQSANLDFMISIEDYTNDFVEIHFKTNVSSFDIPSDLGTQREIIPSLTLLVTQVN